MREALAPGSLLTACSLTHIWLHGTSGRWRDTIRFSMTDGGDLLFEACQLLVLFAGHHWAWLETSW